jgi:hypothetical protein
MELVAAPRAQKAGEEVEEHESNGEAEADRVTEVTVDKDIFFTLVTTVGDIWNHQVEALTYTWMFLVGAQ